MSTQVRVTLPDNAYERAFGYAAHPKRDLSEGIAAALASSLPSIEAIDELKGISKLADREVLAQTELRMDPKADRRLSGPLQSQ